MPATNCGTAPKIQFTVGRMSSGNSISLGNLRRVKNEEKISAAITSWSCPFPLRLRGSPWQPLCR
jgi:hypothetical protein